MPILDDWLKDFPQQYQGKLNIEVLVTAFAKQLQEVEQAFSDINELTDLSTAVGTNLDYVGDIVGLTRKEAIGLDRTSTAEGYMSDEKYRQYLKYQILVNTNECTYYDLMEGLELLWDVDRVYYSEDEEYPATIILEVPLQKDDGTASGIGDVPVIKPAGVSLRYRSELIDAAGGSNCAHIGTGLASKVTLEYASTMAEADVSGYTWLADESENLLTDENGSVLLYE